MRQAIRELGRSGALLAVAAIVGHAATATSAEPPSVIIAFDGSGSMWGKIAGTSNPKFAVAREGLRPGLERISPETRIGLASFGHRRQGDCSDVEIMLKPEKLDPGRIIGLLEKLNPKGRGPLTQALREAAKALPTGPQPSSIILIHDDLDNCQQDPCAAAAEIKKSQPALTIHVVGLGLKKEDAGRMECVAKETGGRMFDAQDAGQASAAIGEVLRLASAVASPQRPPAPVPAPVAAPRPAAPPAPRRPPPQPPEITAPGLHLSALLAPKGEPVEAAIQWRVLRDGSDTPIAEATGPQPVLDVPAGSYVVEARAGTITARQTIDVAAKAAVRAAVVLNASALKLSVPLQLGSPHYPSAIVTIREAGSGTPAGSGKVVWIGPIDNDPLVLPPGTYRVSVEDGLTTRARVVAAALGELAEIEMPLGAGRLVLRAVDREGGAEIDRVVFIVTEDDPETAQGRREVARSAAGAADFTLPAGTYYVAARRGAIEVRDRVLVGAGESVARTMALGLGRVALSARLEGGGTAGSEPVLFRVLAAEAGGREVERAAGPTALVELPAGRYRVESLIGRQNATVLREIEVRAGSELRVAIDHPAASVRFRLAEAVGPSAEAFWEIRDARDRLVWRTAQAEPSALLAAGRYKVRVQVRDRQLERQFDVRAGAGRTLDVTVE